jgi:nicotinamidase-related amidase
MVIDLQDKLVPLVRNSKRVVASAGTLLDGARLFDLPVIATEQYPGGLGHSVDPIARRIWDRGGKFHEKFTFSGWSDQGVRDAILALDRPQAILAGIETHICVQQTALDLASREYEVFVCADAVSSRRKLDEKHALHRMRSEGIRVSSVECVMFELCRRCDSQQFKNMLELIKYYALQDE